MPKNTRTKITPGTKGDNRDKLGRKSKLTPKLTQRICQLISDGNYINISCEAVGISRRSFHSWIEQGGKDIEAGIESKYATFLSSVLRAEAEAETKLVKTVNDATPKNWVAAMTLLERRHPERWGRKDRLTPQKIHGRQVILEVRLVDRTKDKDKLEAGSENQGKVIEGEYRALPEGEQEEPAQTENLDES